MAPEFDPFYKWLGIPPSEQPPNHYRLLAINLFESDPDVIEAAADQRMAHLRSVQTGQYADQSQMLLNKISAARVCLLKPQRKADYDRTLREELAAAAAPATFAPAVEQVAPPPMSFPVPPPRRASVATAPSGLTPPPVVFDAPGTFRPGAGKLRPSSKRSASTGIPLPLLIGAPVVAIVVILGEFVILENANRDDHKAVAQNSSADSTGQDGHVTPPSKTPPASTPTEKIPPVHATDSPSPSTPNANGSNPDIKPPPELKPEEPDPLPKLPPPDAKPPENKPPDVKPSEKKPPETKPPDKETPDKKPSIVPTADTRLAVPDAAEQEKSLAQLKDVLKADYAAANHPEGRAALAARLAKLADQPEEDAALRYVIAAQALDAAVAVGDPTLSADAMDRICKAYRVDVWELRAETYGRLKNSARASDAHQIIAEQLLPLIDQAVAEDRYDVAASLASIALVVTNDKWVDPMLHDKARESSNHCTRLKSKALEVAAAKKTLASDPDDPAANLALGRFLCFEKDDWAAGLPHLVHGGDDALRDVAIRDLAAPAAADRRMAVAEAWWDLAEKAGARGSAARPMAARARYWYNLALPGLTGLPLAKAQRRATEDQAEQDPGAAKFVMLDDLKEQNVLVDYGKLGKHGKTGFPKDDAKQQVIVHGVPIKHALLMVPPSAGKKGPGIAHVSYDIADGKFRVFTATVAILDGAGATKSPVMFRVTGDGKLLAWSRPMTGEGDSQDMKTRLPLSIHELKLEVACQGEHGQAWCVWVNPVLSR